MKYFYGRLRFSGTLIRYLLISSQLYDHTINRMIMSCEDINK